MFILKLVVALSGAVDHFAHHWEIFGMNAAGDQFESHGQIWGKVEDAVQFRRPSDLARLQSPGEGARAAEALALNQECFAAAQMFLGSLTIFDIRACPIPLDDLSAFVS